MGEEEGEECWVKSFGPAFWRARERLGGGEKLRIHRGVTQKKGKGEEVMSGRTD